MEIGELLKVVEKGTDVWVGTDADNVFFVGEVENVAFDNEEFFEDLKVVEISSCGWRLYIEVSQ